MMLKKTTQNCKLRKRPSGSEYTLGRVPMASCDFSTRPYSYADVSDDLDMEKFALVDEDYNYKVMSIIYPL